MRRTMLASVGRTCVAVMADQLAAIAAARCSSRRCCAAVSAQSLRILGEQRRLGEELAKPGYDEPLDLAGRDAQAIRAAGPAAADQRPRNVIPIPRPFLIACVGIIR